MLYCNVTRDVCLCRYFNNCNNDNSDNDDNYYNYAFNYHAANNMYVHSALTLIRKAINLLCNILTQTIIIVRINKKQE